MDNVNGLVGYTSDKGEWGGYKVIVIPSGFFKKGVYGTLSTMPELPLKKIENVPFLFGEDSISKTRNQIFVKADIVASTYFFISRYEELINMQRDRHGRFPAHASLLYKAGLLHTQIVEEYGRLLRKWLGEVGVQLPATKSKYSFVMSHDIDIVSQYRSLRGFVGGLLRGEVSVAAKSFICGVEYDPLFTFGWMKSLESILDGKIKVKTFLKVAGNTFAQDIPYFNPYSGDVRKILELYPSAGIHISYEAAKNPILIKKEVDILSDITGSRVSESRHHFLASLEPKSLRALIDAGITDDYTMGFADCAGFRLGTSRPVKWIDPERREVTNLTLHPLTVMDCTLSREDYMNLDEDEAFTLFNKLRLEAIRFGCEFVSLWHNTSVAKTDRSYHRSLFEKIIKNEESSYSM